MVMKILTPIEQIQEKINAIDLLIAYQDEQLKQAQDKVYLLDGNPLFFKNTKIVANFNLEMITKIRVALEEYKLTLIEWLNTYEKDKE